jgi:hypothetical protein
MKKNIFKTLLLLCFFSISITAHSQDALLSSIIKTVSPIETADLIKKLNIPYNQSILNSHTKTYTSDFKNALNLGVYSSDLGYANINEQSADALNYLTAVKRTADKINVGDFINVGKILGIAANKNNLNMLLEVTTETFEKMSDYLQDQQRSDLAAMVLVGGYVESFYIMCEIAKQYPNNSELTTRVIEQKLVLEQILQVLESPQFAGNQNIKALAHDLKNLDTLMSKYQFVSSGEVITTQKTIGDIEVISISDKNLAPEMTIGRDDLATITGVVSEIRRAIIE